MGLKEIENEQADTTLLKATKSLIDIRKKTRNTKYKTIIEKQDGKRKRNRESYARRKVLKQVKPDFSDVTFNYDAVYQNRMFLGLKNNDYHVMVTVTNHDLVTIKKHSKNVDRLLNWLESRGYIGNSFKVDEKSGDNYHSHILLNLNVTIRSITGIIKRYWQESNGYIDVLKIVSGVMKEKVIKYCLKQLKPTSCLHVKQELIDSWELRSAPNLMKPKSDLFKCDAFLSTIWRGDSQAVNPVKRMSPDVARPSRRM